jgi:hypothetical protein
MRLLTFLAARFAFSPHAATLPNAGDPPPPSSVNDAVVVFVHAEKRDEEAERRKSVLDHARKHVEWLARKKDARNVVLHSFAHLGGDSSSPEFGESFLTELGAKLESRGYSVTRTPFGWTNAWEMAVHGEGFAKVWKEI